VPRTLEIHTNLLQVECRGRVGGSSAISLLGIVVGGVDLGAYINLVSGKRGGRPQPDIGNRAAQVIANRLGDLEKGLPTQCYDSRQAGLKFARRSARCWLAAVPKGRSTERAERKAD